MDVLPPELWGEIEPYLPDALLGLLSREIPPARQRAVVIDAVDISNDSYRGDAPIMRLNRIHCSPTECKQEISFYKYSVRGLRLVRPLFAQLVRINILACSITDASPLRDVPDVLLRNCPELADIRALGGQKELRIVNCPKVLDFSSLTRVPTLTLERVNITQIAEAANDSLTLINCPLLASIGIQRVSRLYLWSCTGVADLRGVTAVTQSLHLGHMKIAHLPALSTRIVVLHDCGVVDISGLKHVERVHLSCCHGITDVSPLQFARGVYLRNCRGVADITPLARVADLRLHHLKVDYTCLGAQYRLDITPLTPQTSQCETHINSYASLQQCYAKLGNCYVLVLAELPPEDILAVRPLSLTVRHTCITG